ncbi:permease [Pseudoramibacter alactolyticus]
MGAWIQNQLLGMHWLNAAVGILLKVAGIDTAGRLGGSLQFWLYDVMKITILLCVLIFLISWIQSYFPPERSRRILARFHGVGANTVGALLGTVTPFCSCSSIPLFIGFTSAGLPLGVTFSFLISSPMVDLASLLLMMSIFGWRIALMYVVFGLVIAVIGGSLIEKLKLDGQVAETFKKVFPYILAGVGIGAVIHNWIPEAWVTAVLGSHNPLGVALATAVGVPMYADIFGTIPIAQALLGKGALLGTVLAFMMAVTTLSLPSLIMLRRAVKPKLLAVFVAICTVGIVAVGYGFNALAPLMG